MFLRILTTALAFGVAGGFGFGVGQVLRQAQQITATFGGGFVLILMLMTMLVLISVILVPESPHRQHRRVR
jgi:hypothetical protein